MQNFRSAVNARTDTPFTTSLLVLVLGLSANLSLHQRDGNCWRKNLQKRYSRKISRAHEGPQSHARRLRTNLIRTGGRYIGNAAKITAHLKGAHNGPVRGGKFSLVLLAHDVQVRDLPNKPLRIKPFLLQSWSPPTITKQGPSGEYTINPWYGTSHNFARHNHELRREPELVS